jgi:hypothetical protein
MIVKDEILLHCGFGLHFPEDMMLSKISQAHKNKHCMWLFKKKVDIKEENSAALSNSHTMESA